MTKINEKRNPFHFLANFEGNGVSLVVDAVFRVIGPLETIAGLVVRRETDAVRLTGFAD